MIIPAGLHNSRNILLNYNKTGEFKIKKIQPFSVFFNMINSYMVITVLYQLYIKNVKAFCIILANNNNMFKRSK